MAGSMRVGRRSAEDTDGPERRVSMEMVEGDD